MSEKKSGDKKKASGDKKEKAGLKIEPMTVAVSASTLFTINDQKAGTSNGEATLQLDVAFPFVKALVKANYYFRKLYPEDEKPFNIFLMNNTVEHQQCIRDSLDELGLNEITIQEDDISGFAGNILYLTGNPEKAESAIKAGHAAAFMFPSDHEVQWSDERKLCVAFDADGVVFSDESEQVRKAEGQKGYMKNETEKEDVLLEAGPLKGFLELLCNLQKKLGEKGPFSVQTYVVTSRTPNACGTRVLKTLSGWDLKVSQAFFLGESPKGRLLASIRPHIYFDDQKRHINSANKNGVFAAQVPYGLGYEAFKGAKDKQKMQ